ncbi:MAG: hypothetical protein R2941_03910 [Desulfobacterales bacterium]
MAESQEECEIRKDKEERKREIYKENIRKYGYPLPGGGKKSAPKGSSGKGD